MQPLDVGEPTTVGPYRLLGRLGSGGMGRVYLGRSAGGRTVAVKIVHPHFALDEEFRARFRREVDAARRVGGAYTAPVLDADPDASIPWVATAYAAGPSSPRRSRTPVHCRNIPYGSWVRASRRRCRRCTDWSSYIATSSPRTYS